MPVETESPLEGQSRLAMNMCHLTLQFPEAARGVLKQCWQQDPKERPSAMKLLMTFAPDRQEYAVAKRQRLEALSTSKGPYLGVFLF